MTAISKQCGEWQAKMATKKDLNEAKAKLKSLERSEDPGDLQAKIVSLHSELGQGLMEVRTDLTKRISDVQNSLYEQIIRKATTDDIRAITQDHGKDI